MLVPEDSRLSYLQGLLFDSMIEDEDSLLNRNIKELKVEASQEDEKRIHDENTMQLVEAKIKEEIYNTFIQKIILFYPLRRFKVDINKLIQRFSKN